MPELPEAETIRCQLEPEIKGRRILHVTSEQPRTWRFHRSLDELAEMIRGRRIVEVGRRGKALFFILDGEKPTALIFRLGMSGTIRLASSHQAREESPAAELTLSGGLSVLFFDPRTFGALIAREGNDIDRMPEFKHHGPEPLADEFTVEYLAKALARRKAKLEDVLMNQRVVAGIGKIYADEICFRAGLRPGRRASGLTGSMRERLWHAIREVLAEGIECRGASARDESYRDIYGKPGEFQERMWVYQRTGQPCRSCGTNIRRTRMSGGRGMHWCPECQK